MSLLAFALLFGIVAQAPSVTAQQNGSQASNQPTQWEFLNQPAPPFSVAQMTPEQKRMAERALVQARQQAAFDKNTCYAIRTYLFRREDGNAPVLVGTTTCTPSTAFQRRNARRSPGSGFVLLNLNY